MTDKTQADQGLAAELWAMAQGTGPMEESIERIAARLGSAATQAEAREDRATALKKAHRSCPYATGTDSWVAWILDALAAPTAPTGAHPTCERCGLTPAQHTPTHWCDNQSFVAEQAAPKAEPVAWLVEDGVDRILIFNTENWPGAFADAKYKKTALVKDANHG